MQVKLKKDVEPILEGHIVEWIQHSKKYKYKDVIASWKQGKILYKFSNEHIDSLNN